MVSLVTGARGLLGFALANMLVRSDESVRLLIRQPRHADLFNNKNIQCVVGDLTDRESLTEAVKGVGTVFHCAATSTDWGSWESFYGANVIGVKNLLDAVVAQSNSTRFIHVSSTDVYGFPEKVVNEDSPMVDVGLPYNQTKILGEKLVTHSFEKYDIPTTTLRPATIYGPRSADFVVEVIEQLKQRTMPLINGGHTSPGLIYVDNVAAALIDASGSESTVGKTYNLRDHSVQSWKTYTTALAEAAGLPPPWLRLPFLVAFPFARSMETLHSCLSMESKPLLTRHAVYLMSRDASFPIDRAKEDFNFQSAVSFECGIEKCVQWYRNEYELDPQRTRARGWWKS